MITSIVRQSNADELTPINIHRIAEEYPIASATWDDCQTFHVTFMQPAWTMYRASMDVYKQQTSYTARAIANRMCDAAFENYCILHEHYNRMVEADIVRSEAELDRRANEYDMLQGYVAGNYDHDDQAYW